MSASRPLESFHPDKGRSFPRSFARHQKHNLDNSRVRLTQLNRPFVPLTPSRVVRTRSYRRTPKLRTRSFYVSYSVRSTRLDSSTLVLSAFSRSHTSSKNTAGNGMWHEDSVLFASARRVKDLEPSSPSISVVSACFSISYRLGPRHYESSDPAISIITI